MDQVRVAIEKAITTVIDNSSDRIGSLNLDKPGKGTIRRFENWFMVEFLHHLVMKFKGKEDMIDFDINRSLYFEDGNHRKNKKKTNLTEEGADLRNNIFKDMFQLVKDLGIAKSENTEAISPDLSIKINDSPVFDIEIKTGDPDDLEDVVLVEGAYNAIAKKFSKKLEKMNGRDRFGGGIFIWVGYEVPNFRTAVLKQLRKKWKTFPEEIVVAQLKRVPQSISTNGKQQLVAYVYFPALQVEV